MRVIRGSPRRARCARAAAFPRSLSLLRDVNYGRRANRPHGVSPEGFHDEMRNAVARERDHGEALRASYFGRHGVLDGNMSLPTNPRMDNERRPPKRAP